MNNFIKFTSINVYLDKCQVNTSSNSSKPQKVVQPPEGRCHQKYMLNNAFTLLSLKGDEIEVSVKFAQVYVPYTVRYYLVMT